MLNSVIRGFAYFTVIKNSNRSGETFSAWKGSQQMVFLSWKVQAKHSGLALCSVFPNIGIRKINVRGNSTFYLIKQKRNKIIWLFTWKKRICFCYFHSQPSVLIIKKKTKYFTIFVADLKKLYKKNHKGPNCNCVCLL